MPSRTVKRLRHCGITDTKGTGRPSNIDSYSQVPGGQITQVLEGNVGRNAITSKRVQTPTKHSLVNKMSINHDLDRLVNTLCSLAALEAIPTVVLAASGCVRSGNQRCFHSYASGRESWGGYLPHQHRNRHLALHRCHVHLHYDVPSTMRAEQ